MNYEHTQRWPLRYILLAAIVAMIPLGWDKRDDAVAVIFIVVIGVGSFVTVLTLSRLTVRDEGAFLAIRFGPLPLFRKRIDYSTITRVDADRSRFIHGWGIHYIPGCGWTYNLWGFDCAKLSVGHRTIRIGSDDVDNLVIFLRKKLSSGRG